MMISTLETPQICGYFLFFLFYLPKKNRRSRCVNRTDQNSQKIKRNHPRKGKGKGKGKGESVGVRSLAQMCFPPSFSLFLLLLHSLTLLTPIHAIIVDVPSGKVKCLTEDLRKGTLSYAQYRVVNASASHLTISSRVIPSSTS
jgi:hypothetical protein